MTPLLSCVNCTEKKIKCDKKQPCRSCASRGIECIAVRRNRLPRGRHPNPRRPLHAHDDGKNQWQAGASSSSEAKTVSPQSLAVSETHASPSTDKQNLSDPRVQLGDGVAFTSTLNDATTQSFEERDLMNQFWDGLVEKHPVLIDAFIEDPAAVTPLAVAKESPAATGTEAGLEGQKDASFLSSPSANQRFLFNQRLELDSVPAWPAPEIQTRLCAIYLERFDPVVKVLHRPSLENLFFHGNQYLTYTADDPVNNCIRATVCYCALVTLSADERQSLIPDLVSNVLLDQRRLCEDAFSRVDLIQTEDMTVLQAFVAYLRALRSQSHGREAWTLFAIAVRISQALGIENDEENLNETYFQQQMRRRLWYSMCHLDMHFALDFASQPLLDSHAALPKFPLNIDDSMLLPFSATPVVEQVGVTDTTLALHLFRVQSTGRIFNFRSAVSAGSQGGQLSLELKKSKLIEIEQHISKILPYCNPDLNALHWTLFYGIVTSLASLRLSFHRPTGPRMQMVHPPDDNPDMVLRLAITVLYHEYKLRTHEKGRAVRWFIRLHWYALSISIGECYTCGKIDLLRQVWPIVQRAFSDQTPWLISFREGSLWRPMEQMMSVTQLRVRKVLRGQSGVQDRKFEGMTLGYLGQNEKVFQDESLSTPPRVSQTSRTFEPQAADGTVLGKLEPQPNLDFALADVSLDNMALEDIDWDAWDDLIDKMPGTMLD